MSRKTGRPAESHIPNAPAATAERQVSNKTRPAKRPRAASNDPAPGPSSKRPATEPRPGSGVAAAAAAPVKGQHFSQAAGVAGVMSHPRSGGLPHSVHENGHASVQLHGAGADKRAQGSVNRPTARDPAGGASGTAAAKAAAPTSKSAVPGKERTGRHLTRRASSKDASASTSAASQGQGPPAESRIPHPPRHADASQPGAAPANAPQAWGASAKRRRSIDSRKARVPTSLPGGAAADKLQPLLNGAIPSKIPQPSAGTNTQASRIKDSLPRSAGSKLQPPLHPAGQSTLPTSVKPPTGAKAQGTSRSGSLPNESRPSSVPKHRNGFSKGRDRTNVRAPPGSKKHSQGIAPAEGDPLDRHRAGVRPPTISQQAPQDAPPLDKPTAADGVHAATENRVHSSSSPANNAAMPSHLPAAPAHYQKRDRTEDPCASQLPSNGLQHPAVNVSHQVRSRSSPFAV